MPDAVLIIGFRDRGTDPLRKQNLEHVLDYWRPYGYPIHLVDDGGTGSQQWNRHKAYNHAARTTTADVLCYVEADMILPYHQMDEAIAQTAATPGLIVPFTERHELGPEQSEQVRNGADYRTMRAPVVMPKPRRTGAINVLSRHTLELVGGYDEEFTGSHWDDRSMHLAFETCCGPGSTRWIDGPAWHLYHLPGHTGSHLTAQDRAATHANHLRYKQYRKATTPQQIRKLTGGVHA